MMSHKRRGQEDDRKKQRPSGKRSRWSKQHLYLVLDDWDNGFSIHKIDAESFVSCSGSDAVSCSSSDEESLSWSSSDDEDAVSCSVSDDDEQGAVAPRRLPEPPALRLESPNGNNEADTDMAFSAMGTKIFVFIKGRCGLVYDADTAVLAVGGAHAPAAKTSSGFGISVHVGDVLYLLTYRSLYDHGQHSFDAMSTKGGGGGGWSWKTLPAPPPTFTAGQMVVAHAVHPDGCTIFMTTANRGAPGAPVGTYLFNTREATWRWHGECALPFHGQGHFDAELNAWVGLRRDGYLCSCQAVSVDFLSTRPLRKHLLYTDPHIYLDCKTTKQKLFRKDPGGYMRASLTSMGSGRFCLVECVASKERRKLKLPLFGDYHSCVLHMTIFGLRYDHKGELQITDQRSRRSFVVSRHISCFGPFAFWM